MLGLRACGFRRAWGRSSRGRRFLKTGGSATRCVQNSNDVGSEIDVIPGIHDNRNAVKAHTRFIKDEVETVRLHFLHYYLSNFFNDSFAHPQCLLLKLALAG